MGKIIFVDTPQFCLNDTGDIIDGKPTHEIQGGWRKTYQDVLKEFKDKKGRFLFIYAPNAMIKPYYDFVSTYVALDDYGHYIERDPNICYGGWTIRYIIVDKNLKCIN